MTGKIKPCKECPSKRFANTSWCFKHYREREKIKKEIKAVEKLIKKQSTKRYLKSELKRWNNKTWKLMSEYVRRKDADWRGWVKCYTCYRLGHWKEMQAGHRYHRTLDYSLDNIKPQCPQCNMSGHGGKSGNLGEYEHNLIKDYGLEWAQNLRREAHAHMGYTLEEIKQKHAELTQILEKIRKEQRDT
jgi:hypothetical protein